MLAISASGRTQTLEMAHSRATGVRQGGTLSVADQAAPYLLFAGSFREKRGTLLQEGKVKGRTCLAELALGHPEPAMQGNASTGSKAERATTLEVSSRRATKRAQRSDSPDRMNL